MSSDQRDGGDDPGSVEDAFSVLGDKTRLSILLELAEVVREQGFGEGLSFANLRERVGVRDSGRFNYHLDKLTDGFVEQDDGEYVVHFPGLAVVAAVYSGLYSDGDGAAASVELDRTCQFCENNLDLRYEGTEIWYECPEHGAYDKYTAVPPGAYADRTIEELGEVAYTRLLVNLMLARQHICLQCWGATTVEYPVEFPGGEDPYDGEFIWTSLACTRCWNQFTVPIRTVVGTHQLVLGPFRERGDSMREAVRTLTDVGEDGICETVLHEGDQPSATVEIDLGDEHLELTVDEDCTVVGFERDG